MNTYKVVGCKQCKSVKITEAIRPRCFYCGGRTTEVYGIYTSQKEARDHLMEVKREILS